jgi:hypothetical protein
MRHSAHFGLLALAAAGLAVGSAHAYSGGIVDHATIGCGGTNCHGLSGVTENTTTRVYVLGLPQAAGYTPAKSYDITVFVQGVALPAPQFAGFDLFASAGTLEVPDNESFARMSFLTDRELTHRSPKAIEFQSNPGDGSATPWTRWDLRWTAPPTGSGPVTFSAAGNVVNGDGIPDEGDVWSIMDPVTICEGGPCP